MQNFNSPLFGVRGILKVVDRLRFESIAVLYYCIVYYWVLNRKQRKAKILFKGQNS